MTVDYDLVILGGTLSGRRAAKLASRYGARVALVEPPDLFATNQQADYLLAALQAWGHGQQQAALSELFLTGPLATGSVVKPEAPEDLAWSQILAWSALAADSQVPELSPAALATGGVDVVLEMPESLSRQLGVKTASRRLRSRAVLAAYGCSPEPYQPLLTAGQLPASVVITGNDAQAVQWAETLGSLLVPLGIEVTLQTSSLLSGWDDDIRQLVRSQLAVAGVSLGEPLRDGSIPATIPATVPADRSSISAARAHCSPLAADSSSWQLSFSAAPPALSLPAFVATRPPQPAPRNLEGSAAPRFIRVNRKLQTSHPRIFACGPILGGSSSETIAQHESAIAVANALFLPSRTLDYAPLAQGWGQFARAGFTPDQARHSYGDAIGWWSASHPNSATLTQAVPLPCFCKLVCQGQQLLGIHLFGPGAGTAIEPLSLALGAPVDQLARQLSGAPSPTAQPLMSVVQAAANQAMDARWQIGHRYRDWAENWFNWRRNQDPPTSH